MADSRPIPPGCTVTQEWNWLVSGDNAQAETVSTIAEPTTDTPETFAARVVADFDAACSDVATRPKFQASPPATITLDNYKSGGAMVLGVGTEAAGFANAAAWYRAHRSKLVARLATAAPDVA